MPVSSHDLQSQANALLRDTRKLRTILLHADTRTEQPRIVWQRNQ